MKRRSQRLQLGQRVEKMAIALRSSAFEQWQWSRKADKQLLPCSHVQKSLQPMCKCCPSHITMNINTGSEWGTQFTK
jgi:hypothetical protein